MKNTLMLLAGLFSFIHSFQWSEAKRTEPKIYSCSKSAIFACSCMLVQLIFFFQKLNTHQTENIRYHFDVMLCFMKFSFASRDWISTKIYSRSIFASIRMNKKHVYTHERASRQKKVKERRSYENPEDREKEHVNRFSNFAENYLGVHCSFRLTGFFYIVASHFCAIFFLFRLLKVHVNQFQQETKIHLRFMCFLFLFFFVLNFKKRFTKLLTQTIHNLHGCLSNSPFYSMLNQPLPGRILETFELASRSNSANSIKVKEETRKSNLFL